MHHLRLSFAQNFWGQFQRAPSQIPTPILLRHLQHSGPPLVGKILILARHKKGLTPLCYRLAQSSLPEQTINQSFVCYTKQSARLDSKTKRSKHKQTSYFDWLKVWMST